MAQSSADYNPFTDNSRLEKQLLDDISKRFQEDQLSVNGKNKKYILEMYKERYETIKKKFDEKEVITNQEVNQYLKQLTDEIINPNRGKIPGNIRIQFSRTHWPNASSMGRDGAKALAELSAANGKPVRKVSYLHIEGAFGQSVHDAFAEEAEKEGIEMVSEVTYPATNFTDATTQVREALAADPDVLAVTGYYPDSLLIAQAIRALGGDVDAVYGVANGGFDDSAFPADAGAAGADVLSANYHYAATDERAQDIRARFEQKYGRTMETSAMLAYQAVVVIAQGLEETGSKDPEELRDAIAGLQVEDPLLEFKGPIAFDETGENENASVTVMQIRDGRIEQVFPDQFKTADIVYPVGR